MSATKRTILCSFLALALVATSGVAQSGVPVRFVLKSEFGRPDIVAIVRIERSKFAEPVVALKASALTPQLVATAVGYLRAMNRKFGLSSTEKVSVELTATSRLRAVRASEELWIAQLTSSLRNQPERQLSVIGKGREAVVRLNLDQ
jgi:hypothetical protein